MEDWWGLLFFLPLGIAVFTMKIARPWERVVLFRLGEVVGLRGPGFFFVLPLFDVARRVDLRAAACDLAPQEVITRDEKTGRVQAMIVYRILDPVKAVTAVEDYRLALRLLAAAELRDICSHWDFHHLLHRQQFTCGILKNRLDTEVRMWGIQVEKVAFQRVEVTGPALLPPNQPAPPDSPGRASLRRESRKRDAAGKLCGLIGADLVAGARPAAVKLGNNAGQLLSPVRPMI